MNFEQDLCDKLQHCIEPVLYALKRPHVLPQRDDVFFDDEVDETSDLLKEIHGAPIFDVYDDIDHIFDDCGDADITSNVFDEVSDIIIVTQEVSNNNFVPKLFLQIINSGSKAYHKFVIRAQIHLVKVMVI